MSANPTGPSGTLRFFGQAKVVSPDGDVLARTAAAPAAPWRRSPRGEKSPPPASRAAISHLEDRATDTYRVDRPAPAAPRPARPRILPELAPEPLATPAPNPALA